MKTLQLTWHTKSYLRVSIDNGPINLFDQALIDDLQELTGELEKNEDLKVVVFDSANENFFISHLDILGAADLDLTPAPQTGLSLWPDVAVRFERAPFITVGLLRGRARGVGSEFLLALDTRFASKEKAKLCQIELGTGIIPGGGGLERLPVLVGRSRAIEIIGGAQEFDADTAALYGWVNRSIPDNELDVFVDNFARRIASFDKKTIALAKEIINERTGVPTVEDLASTEKKFFTTLSLPETQERLGILISKGLQQYDFELELPKHLSTY
jgi:enoyl-CoA hydratase/carnithine racemase